MIISYFEVSIVAFLFSSSIIESVQETLFKCGPQSGHGRIVYIGWKSSGFDFKPLITICHDRTIDHTYFANHEIIGKTYIYVRYLISSVFKNYFD